MSFKKICICLILIFCIIGAASAAEDVSTDVVDASADAVAVDAVSEDVSDSLESVVVEDEPVVVDSASAQDEIDDVELGASVDDEPALDEVDDELSGQSPKLTDDNDEIYVVIDDPTDYMEVVMAFANAVSDVNEGGIVYLPACIYNDTTVNWDKNITIIGLDKDNVIINGFYAPSFCTCAYNSIINYINLTFSLPLEIDYGTSFTNCTFTNSKFIVGGQVYNIWAGAPENYDYEESFIVNFTNCEFKNSIADDSFVELCKYSQLNFFNCTFKDITSNSIVKNAHGFIFEDAINFYDCTFNNVNVKGIVDVPTGTTPVERYRIEGCTGVEGSEPLTLDGRDFVNTTQSRTETVLVADIDDEGNLFINLTDDSGNAVAEADVLISVNGAEATPYTLGTDGTLSIALTDLTDATGKLNIAVSFEEDDDYKGSSDSISTVLVVNTVTEVINNTIVEYVNKTLESTSIVANALTATAKVAKTLSVTLKDASGKAIANKVITYSINGVTKTVKTDANGIAKITVNQAKAGAYYYSLCFLGDDDYKSAFKSVKVTVNKQATKAVFKAKSFKVKAKTKKVSFTLKDAKGKAIKGKKITVKVNGKTYTAKTNAKGVATVSLKITKKGKYTATAKFAGDTTYKAITKKAKITLK